MIELGIQGAAHNPTVTVYVAKTSARWSADDAHPNCAYATTKPLSNLSNSTPRTVGVYLDDTASLYRVFVVSTRATPSPMQYCNYQDLSLNGLNKIKVAVPQLGENIITCYPANACATAGNCSTILSTPSSTCF